MCDRCSCDTAIAKQLHCLSVLFQPPTLKKSLVEAYIILVRVLALSGALRQAEHSSAQNEH